ncbi:MAG: hypothetical protein OCC45_06450 [Desulfotalea sp.]
MIDKNLGKSLTAKQISELMGLSVTTVRLNYQSLGGFRVGSRYVFFEKRLVDAVLEQTTRSLDRSSSPFGAKIPEDLSQKIRSKAVGSRNKKGFEKKKIITDGHNLLT